jgi:casein kinase II subunit alpha
MGTRELYEYLEKYNLVLDQQFNGLLHHFPKKQWSKFITKDNHKLASPEAVDLLDKMLIYDHTERILPLEALQHPYFNDVLELWDAIEKGTCSFLSGSEQAEYYDIISRRQQEDRN